MKRKVFNYYTLALILKSLYESCMKAWEQQKNGEKVTACGMSDEDIETLCQDILPNMLNPMMSAEEVKDRLGVSDATLNRMVKRGDIPNGECKKRGHTRYWKKWDILWFIRKKNSYSSVCSNSCGSYDYLGIDVSDNEDKRYGCTCLHSLEDINKDYYYAQDFTAHVRGASNKEALRFLNAAPQLFKLLDEIEEKQVQVVKDALEKTKNL